MCARQNAIQLQNEGPVFQRKKSCLFYQRNESLDAKITVDFIPVRDFVGLSACGKSGARHRKNHLGERNGSGQCLMGHLPDHSTRRLDFDREKVKRIDQEKGWETGLFLF